MVLTKTDIGINNFIDVKGKLHVDFGCGIGPKVILSESGHMAVLSQSSNVKEINLYKITTLWTVLQIYINYVWIMCVDYGFLYYVTFTFNYFPDFVYCI